MPSYMGAITFRPNASIDRSISPLYTSTERSFPESTCFRREVLPNIHMSAENSPANQELQSDIDKLKDPSSYKETFERKEVQELQQAIDIIATLRTASYKDASKVGWEKLAHARDYLDRLLKKQFEDPEQS
jgi:hypothetical protein